MTPQYRHAPPKASAMIEALRGLGYSTATALADIIDNSITAGAKNVDLKFAWNGRYSHITIQDDGNGMDEAELDRAMRLGEQSPLDARDSNDLGRFGLGLKTASFSQCRRLTVASRKTDAVGCLRWDLDILTASADDGVASHRRTGGRITLAAGSVTGGSARNVGPVGKPRSHRDTRFLRAEFPGSY